MGAICGRESVQAAPPYHSRIRSMNSLIANEDELNFNPGVFVKENIANIYQVYEISSTSLGTGRNGDVRKCVHKLTKDTRVVKIIAKSELPIHMLETRAMFNEVEILKTVDHPNLPRIFEFFEDDSSYYIVLEFCTGGDLFDRILEVKKFDEKQAAEIMFHILSGVTYLHSKNIVHRDIKPENILLTSKEGLSLKIIDFDTATVFKKDYQKEMHGTPLYMAPEIVKGKYTEKCDLWSSGMIMFIMLTGGAPYDGTDDEIIAILKSVKINIDLMCSENSPEARDLLKKLLEPDPVKRVTAKEACCHPWIKLYTQNVSKKDIEKVLLRIKSFKKTTKLKEAIHTFIISKIMDPKLYKTEQAVFNYLDINRDGTISSAELVHLLMQDMPVEEAQMYSDLIMDHVDSDKNGSIDYTEFLRASISVKKICTRENILNAFRYFDEDGSGSIEYSELQKALSDGDIVITEDLIEQLMNQIDTNGDGKIDIDEFENLLIENLVNS
jgi:calcium-dependent protein kinase